MIFHIFRRRKNKDLENTEQSSTNKCNFADSADYSNVENLTESNYCELQQPNVINQSENYSQLQFEGTDNNGYSDLPENNAASEISSNDIYDNM